MELFAPQHLLLILLIILLVFGGKKIPELMRGLGEGVRSFKEGMSGNPTQTQPPAQPQAPQPPQQQPPPPTQTPH
jgi:sec-independent protein translocase protein TatA